MLSGTYECSRKEKSSDQSGNVLLETLIIVKNCVDECGG